MHRARRSNEMEQEPCLPDAEPPPRPWEERACTTSQQDARVTSWYRITACRHHSVRVLSWGELSPLWMSHGFFGQVRRRLSALLVQRNVYLEVRVGVQKIAAITRVVASWGQLYLVYGANGNRWLPV